MKRLFAILLAAALLLALAGCGEKIPVDAPTSVPTTNAPASDETAVTTLKQFIRAIGSGKTIRLDAEILLSPSTDRWDSWEEIDYGPPQPGSETLRWEEVYDGWELVISGVDDLTIRCGPKGSLVTEPRYSFVLCFEDCTGITLEGITAGHTEGGTCEGGVLRFTDCNDIQIKDCDLYGCGTEGLVLDHVTGLSMQGGAIHDCTLNIMRAERTKNLTFTGCDFLDSGEYTLVQMATVEGILFEDCLFEGNRGDVIFGEIWGSRKCVGVTVKGCTFRNNLMDINSVDIVFEDCSFDFDDAVDDYTYAD